MNQANKVLKIDHEKCTGCRLCELVCSVRHHHVSNPAKSRIRIVKWEADGVYVPISCQQCEDAPCATACPAKALARNADQGRVEVDYDRCIGCKLCMSVCPFGAMRWNTAERKVIKCDLCDGDPQCVRFCEMKAVDYVDAARVGTARGREAAERLLDANRKGAELQKAGA